MIPQKGIGLLFMFPVTIEIRRKVKSLRLGVYVSVNMGNEFNSYFHPIKGS